MNTHTVKAFDNDIGELRGLISQMGGLAEDAIDAVRLRIGMAISLGLLGPGERLPDQSELALGLSVSPITARRALTSLAEQGVVVRRRGRGGGTFVADHPPAAVLRNLVAGPGESVEVHRLVDQRLLLECAVTHFAALNATPEQLDELERLTARMAAAASSRGSSKRQAMTASLTTRWLM